MRFACAKIAPLIVPGVIISPLVQGTFGPTNYTQTTGDEVPPIGYPKRGTFVIRDIPKSISLTTEDSIQSYATVSLIYSGEGSVYDLQTVVIEAGNNHKYWLNQTISITFYTYDNTPYVIEHTFTDEDWATSPPYDAETGIGFVENPTGPSAYVNRYLSFYEGDELYLTNDSVAEATPHDFFQPPGD